MPIREIRYMTKDEMQHLEVLEEAQALFAERSEVRGDLWRQFPISDKVRELRERVSRMESILNVKKMRPDVARAELRKEALDHINYAAFIIKQLDEGFDL